jgi:type III restriction enzyme
MELKKYQRRVADEMERYLRAVADEQAKGNRKHAAKDAWEELRIKGTYSERRTGAGEDLATFCIKVPTGGGKTLLATQALGSIYRTILRARGGAGGGAGLVLWVVPTSQIYRDTLKNLRDRNHGYRQMLEHAASRRIEVWEKDEVARLGPARLRDALNILVVQLASTNRQTKEDLKFFRDSGGSIVDHFPPENDPAAHKDLKARVPNLDMIEEDEKSGRFLCKTSIGNLVRLCQPAVILDEGHKAYSTKARETIETFNPSIVVELSATPPDGANVLCRVSGEDLLEEEMIKLPLNVKTSGRQSWQTLLTEARDRRLALARSAETLASAGGLGARLIRPIVLVQVQATGKKQLGKKTIHADTVRDFLRQKLDVGEKGVVIKSAENDGLAEVEDLMDPGCPVEWIITKSALQEGWDCPFAYILVSLDNTGSGRAMTQLVGRVLRQPFQTRAPAGHEDLNESYAFCLHTRPGDVLRQVKTALEKEGYEGEARSMIRDVNEGAGRMERVANWRKGISDLYTRPFEGKIYLPRFCVKVDGGYEPLDYFQHLVGRVDVGAFEYGAIDWPIAKLIEEQKDRVYRVTLGEDPTRHSETELDLEESDERVLSWMVANLEFPFLSHKQVREIVGHVYARLLQIELTLKGRLARAKTVVRNHVAAFIGGQMDTQTERAFGELFDAGKVLFYLECALCRFEMPDTIRLENKGGAMEPLIHDDGDPVGRSLFDFVERSEFNEYERQVALVMDRDANVLWWYRNRVGRDQFMVQGFRREKIFPDFVVQGEYGGRPLHRVLVIEAKGEHLQAAPDTEYKRRVAGFFERAGHQVTWQQLGTDFKDHIFRFQVVNETDSHGRSWRDTLSDVLSK